MGKLLKVTLIGILLAFIGERIVQFCHRANAFRKVDPVDLLPNCQLLKGIEFGSEDIEILPNGLAFISSGLKYPGVMNFQPDKPGEIFLLDLNDEKLRPVPLRLSRGFDFSTFNPHGMSTYIDPKDDTVYLFVVNHPLYKTTIELFKFEEEENVLLHLKTIKHDLMWSANDIVAVGPESFYTTNDLYFTDFTMRQLEIFLGIAWSNVIYYSPTEVKQVSSGYYYANGIAMSTDNKYIYVADIMGHTIDILEKQADWSLTPVKVLKLDTLLDNLFVDPNTGDIWTGAHPNGWKLFSYNSDDLPGSEVIRVQNIHSDNPIVTQVYVNNGSVIQASSSAAVYEGKLLIGTVFHKALCCELS
ncbi:serum paraoxonase/arylesterase 2 [Xenopus laevis]|uniref:Paraoxonase n=1 Tax=Xenopus laevis TaxID=8355 RepID=Q7ZTN3_XENLA|nr:serum paraoxonase/arylesterase 2 [Xenopus laevis]AAH44294.1 Pon1-prov protein [Xenopus laevis]